MKDEFFSDEPVFDLSGAAKYLGISKVQMRTLARAGRVTYSRIDRCTGDSRNAIWTPISRETPLRRGACLKEENEPRKRILFSCWPANSNRPPTPPRSYRDTRSARSVATSTLGMTGSAIFDGNAVGKIEGIVDVESRQG